jgi:hypothetical protein
MCFVAWWMLTPSATAATRLSVQEPGVGLHIRVDVDAPAVIELKSDDILPIRWERQGVQDTILPAIATRRQSDLTIVDDSSNAYALAHKGVLPQVLFDPSRYARDTSWHGQPSAGQRKRHVLLGILFSLGLLLVLLVRRYTLAVACVYCLAWAGGLLIALSNRPALVRESVHPELPVDRLYAREAQTVRFPIGSDAAPCVPIVESPDHLRTISARVEVRGEEAELVVDLPKGAKLFLTAIANAERLREDQTR